MRSLEVAVIETGVHADTLAIVSRILEWVFIVAGVAGVIVGAVVAAHSGTIDNGAFPRKDHPDLGAGIALMTGAVLSSLVSWAFFRALRLFGEYVLLRLRVDHGLVKGALAPGGAPDRAP